MLQSQQQHSLFQNPVYTGMYAQKVNHSLSPNALQSSLHPVSVSDVTTTLHKEEQEKHSSGNFASTILHSNSFELQQIQETSSGSVHSFIKQELPFFGAGIRNIVTHNGEVPSSLSIEDLLKTEPFLDSNRDHGWTFTPIDGYDDELTNFLEMEDGPSFKGKTTKTKINMTVNTLPSYSLENGKKPTRSPSSTILGDSPKSRRAVNSLNDEVETKDTPIFSLEECSNEFYVHDGDFAFQDETEEVLRRMSIPNLQKKKSTSKLGKSSAKPPLRKSKTTPNLGRLLPKNASRILKNMESGLLSFQI